jgi:hypothetical protein
VHGLRDDIRMHFIREDDFSFMKALSGDDDGELLRLLDMNISKLTEMEEVAECGN